MYRIIKANIWVLAAVITWPSVSLATKTVTYYYTDPQGTIIEATDDHGNVVERDDFRPFGNEYSLEGASEKRYAGHVADSESDLIYMQARYYDPDVGRFISIDLVLPEPAALDLMNRYAYVANNPMTLTDPTGAIPEGGSSSDFNCEVYHCERSGSGASQTEASVDGSIPVRTPQPMVRYFGDTSPSGRVIAGKAVMDYFHINYRGLIVVYDSRMSLANAAMDRDGTLTLGPPLFGESFGLIGAMLAHEVEGHWWSQMFRATSFKQDRQSFWMREVQAYDIELSPVNISRFGLTPEEVGTEAGKRNSYFNGLNEGNKSLIKHHIYKPLGD